MNKPIIIKNGRCKTMDAKGFAEWIFIKNGKISEMGIGEGYERYLASDVKVIDAKGATVLPGFVDSHFHMVITGISEGFINMEDVNDFKSMGQKIEEARAKNPGKLIVANKLDCDKLVEKCFPDRTVIDKYCNDAPVAVYSSDYHALILNTYGILHFKVPFTLGGIELNEKGMPTGVFTNQAGSRLDTSIFSSYTDDEIDSAVSDRMGKLLSCGLTTVAAMEGGNMNFDFNEDHECEFIYKYGDKYPVSMDLFYQTTDIDYVLKKGLKRIGGALYIDGTIGQRTAALSSEYTDKPGQKGLFSFDSELLKAFVASCYENDLQVALDAIGDAAIEASIVAFEYAAKLHGKKDLRGRIEHSELITEDQMKRARDLGIILSMQPAYEGQWGGEGKMYQQRLGDRYKNTNPLREIIDHDIVLCGGSDSDITDMNPMVGIHYAVNHPVESHRVSLDEAIKMYTYNGAYGLFREKEVGSLAEGKTADIVIMEDDLDALPVNQLKTGKVATTIKAGKVLFNRCIDVKS